MTRLTVWILRGTGALLLALIAYVAAAGGPVDAWRGVQAMIWGHPAPTIISLEAERSSADSFILTIRNPAIEEVIVTGYEAVPLAIAGLAASTNASDDGGGEATLISADEQKPDECGLPRFVRLPRPIIIKAGRAVAVRIRPWEEPCPFDVRVYSNHGVSSRADTMTALLRQYGIDPEELEMEIEAENFAR